MSSQICKLTHSVIYQLFKQASTENIWQHCTLAVSQIRTNSKQFIVCSYWKSDKIKCNKKSPCFLTVLLMDTIFPQCNPKRK